MKRIVSKNYFPKYFSGSVLFEWVKAELEKPSSDVFEFLEYFALDFILENLSDENKRIFVKKIMKQNDDFWEFASRKIENFDDKFSKAVGNKFVELLTEAEAIQSKGEVRLTKSLFENKNFNRKD